MNMYDHTSDYVQGTAELQTDAFTYRKRIFSHTMSMSKVAIRPHCTMDFIIHWTK
jgi:hypothetical protein